MRKAHGGEAHDFRCPHCGAALKAEDPDDFQTATGSPMYRDEDYWAECPGCGRDFSFHVTWEPSYPYAPVAR